jgi:hypothetical protein
LYSDTNAGINIFNLNEFILTQRRKGAKVRGLKIKVRKFYTEYSFATQAVCEN